MILTMQVANETHDTFRNHTEVDKYQNLSLSKCLKQNQMQQ